MTEAGEPRPGDLDLAALPPDALSAVPTATEEKPC